MSSNSTAYKKLNLLEALTKNMCCIANACKDIGISRRTFYHWTETDKEFKEQYEDIQDKLLDFAESMLLKNIAKGDNAAILFYLKSKGKHRGYGDDSSKEQKDIKELTDIEFEEKLQQYERRQAPARAAMEQKVISYEIGDKKHNGITPIQWIDSKPFLKISFDSKWQYITEIATDDELKLLIKLHERYEQVKMPEPYTSEDQINEDI